MSDVLRNLMIKDIMNAPKQCPDDYGYVGQEVGLLDDLFKTVQVKQQLLEEKSKTERYNYYGDDRDYAQCLKCPVVSKYSHVIRKRMWEYAKSLNNDEDLFKVFMANQPY